MRLKDFNWTIVLVLFLLVSFSCDGKNNPDTGPTLSLKLEESSITLHENEQVRVKIISGNGNYNVSTSPIDIVLPRIVNNNNELSVRISALKIGNTTITVRDHKNETATIVVAVKKEMEKTPPIDPDADGKFALAIYPDTQTEVFADVVSLFVERSEWVVSQRYALDIRGVLHIGDVVNWDDAPVREIWSPADDHRQFVFAAQGLAPLRDAGIPTSLSIGNHDTMATGGDNGGSARDTRYTYEYQRMTESFNYYLNDAKLIPTWVAFEKEKVDNGYWTFEAAGAKWLVLNLELWPRLEVVDWAKDVIAKNPGKNVIIQSHNIFNGACNIDGADQDRERWQYGDSSPQRVWNQLVEPYENVKIVTSGHTGRQCANVFTTGKGNKVIGTLQNNVDVRNRYNPVRILEIDVENGTATTWNYAPQNNSTRDEVELTGLTFIKE